MNTPRKPVTVEKDLWSESSRRSGDYLLIGDFYEDKPFSCRVCGANAVFTAEQQKYAYEVKKAHTWEQHLLCLECFEQRNTLIAEAATYAAEWARTKAQFRQKPAAIRRWKEVLEILPRFGVRKDSARIRMLAKLLDAA